MTALIAAVLIGGVFFTALDQTGVVTAIPDMIAEFEISFDALDQTAWIISGFLLGYTVAMPLAGRLSDLHPRQRVYVGALAVFVAGSILSALAPTVWVLVVGRVMQAAGGGAVVPVSMAIVAAAYVGRARYVAIGTVAAAAEAGGVIGPLWGGAITEWIDWRWIFWLNVPVSAVIAPIVWRATLPRPEGRGAIEWTTLACLAAALTLGVLGLSLPPGVQPGLMAILLATSVLLLAAVVLRSLRSATPILDVRLFKDRRYAAANVASLLMGCGLIVAMVNVPLFSSAILQRGSLDGGLLLMRMTLWIPLAALVGAWLAARLGPGPIAAFGFVAAAGGLALQRGWDTSVTEWIMTRDLSLAGIGFGLVLAPLTASAIAVAGPAFAGVAAGVVVVARLVGMMVSVAWLTPWGVHQFKERAAFVPAPAGSGAEFDRAMGVYAQSIIDIQVGVFHDLFTIAAIVIVLAVGPALFLGVRSVREVP